MILLNCRVPVPLSDELAQNSTAAEMYSLMKPDQRNLINKIAQDSKTPNKIKSLACDIADGCFPSENP